MKLNNIKCIIILAVFIVSCQVEDQPISTESSLRVLHASPNVSGIHVDYFQQEINLATNPALFYQENIRFTLPANEDRNVLVIPSNDTLSIAYQKSVNFRRGESHTLALTGNVDSIEGILFKDELLKITDSIVGVRFINLASNIGSISVGTSGGSSNIVESINFGEASVFNEVTATQASGSYLFQFKDTNNNVLASTFLNPLPPFGIKPIFKNFTYALVGNSGNLSVVKIDHF
ncbi:DUF4397 domain-containing protein [Flavivirga amylovorans]|uniref:DUF4397 domain-containing protein n=1 Tax=Flavivirga amylovorans TaxID=870486 RepID=A0ABT8X1D8_9FLAO|nr:DUF4397 domain-containing protein [Flavivirga amylovorans]MDO5987518.1 DUF4397 domain-containing protein [Flavivirga amylovorans]